MVADRVQTVVLRSGGRPDAPVRAARGTLAPGAMVGGRYRIDRLLGAGGMAQVWLADDVERRMQVAFKEMTVPRLRTAAELEESALLFPLFRTTRSVRPLRGQAAPPLGAEPQAARRRGSAAVASTSR